MSQYHLNYLKQLEAESIQIFREVAAQFENRPFYSAVEKILL